MAYVNYTGPGPGKGLGPGMGMDTGTGKWVCNPLVSGPIPCPVASLSIV